MDKLLNFLGKNRKENMEPKTDKKIAEEKKMSENPNYAWEKLSVKQKVEKLSPLDPTTPIREDCLRVVCISDTHNRMEIIPSLVPPGDVLLHSGDFTMIGLPSEIENFNTFLGVLPHTVKVVIAGNHDMTLDKYSVENRRKILKTNFNITETKFEDYLKERNIESSKQLLTNCIFLEDQSLDVCGIKVYGTPWVPHFCEMGFNVFRGADIMEKWNLIPSDTDILMTHGPPLGHGDKCIYGDRAGCLDLLYTIQKRVKPKYHIFGHIHEDYGATTDGTTTFINASMCTLRYQPEQTPIVFDIPIPAGHTKEELNLIVKDQLQNSE